MNKTTVQIAIDLGITVAVLAYFVAQTQPEALAYLRTVPQRVRYKLWELKYPSWLQEALTVRGKLS